MGYNLGDFPERINRSENEKEKVESKMNAFALTGFDNFNEAKAPEKPKGEINTRGLFDKTDFTDNVAYNVVDVPIEYLKNDPNNNFRPLVGEKREELKQSILEHGIQTPLMVRRKGQKYEIICGNNRKSIAEELDMKMLPCIIKEVDDYEASILAGIDNINRREEISDIEKGWAFRRAYDALVQKKGGNDKVEKGRMRNDEFSTDSPNPHEGDLVNEGAISPSPLAGDLVNEGKTESKIAKDFGVSKNTIFRKMRLTHLIDEMLELFENKKISQEVAVELSYLKPIQQRHTIAEMSKYKKIPVECAKDLHKEAENNPEMGVDDISNIFYKYYQMEKEQKPKAKSRRYSLADELFPSYLIDPKERLEYVEEILRKALEKQPNLD